MSEWVSVKDRLPEVGAEVIICYRHIFWHDKKVGRVVEPGCLLPGGRWVSLEEEDDVTHWMPLPACPEEEK